MSSNLKWKIFERLVAAIHHAADRGGQITWDDTINGRQFDVTIRFKKGFYTFLTVIECKNYKNSIPVEKVEAFVTKASDAKANKAILVTSSSFQAGCLSVAEKHNIGLYTLKAFNELPKEVMGDHLVPAFNIFDIKLLSNEGKKYIFPEYGGKLTYLVMNTKMALDKKNIILNAYLSEWIQSKINDVISGKNNFEINFDETIAADIPQEDVPILFNSIHFKCKFIEVHPISTPTLDPYLLQKINANLLYKNEISGEIHKINYKELLLGLDTIFEEGKFYFNPKLEFFYFCKSIENDSATIYLVESYQHGKLLQTAFKCSTKNSKHYIEVTNDLEIRRLTKILQRMTS